ncbi:MAG: hypothetical protein GF334_07790, partial [Candidatus Altiarchaeales archaeon]|nr:hypothetical protein [Candidatus Altiarchaeales archaeon]
MRSHLKVALSIALILLLLSPLNVLVIAQAEDEEEENTGGEGVANAAGGWTWNKFREMTYYVFGGFIFMDALYSGYNCPPGNPSNNNPPPPCDYGSDSGTFRRIDHEHPVIRILATKLLTVLVPLFEILVLITGIYYVWGAFSPQARSKARDQLIRLVAGMLACSLSLYIFDIMMHLSVWATRAVLSKDATLFNPIDVIFPALIVTLAASLIPIVIYIITLIVTGGASFPGVALLLAFFIPIVLPFFVIIIRYAVMLFFGAIFPLTLFLMSFDFTKGLGTKILVMTVNWMMVPFVMAVIINLIVFLSQDSFLAIDRLVQVAAFLLMGVAPLMMMQLMSVAGGLMINAGRATANPRMVFLGYYMMGYGSQSFIQTAQMAQLMDSRAQGQRTVAKDYEQAADKGIDHAGAAPPAPRRGLSRAALKADGYTGWGAAVEFGKRLVFDRKDSSSSDEYKSHGQMLRERASKDWSGSRGVVGKSFAGGKIVAYSLGSLAGSAYIQSLRASGVMLRGVSRQFTVKGTQSQQSLTRMANRLTGYWERDSAGQARFNYGYGRFTSTGKSLSKYDKLAKEGAGPGAVPRTHFKGISRGVAVATGLSLAGVFLTPAMIPVVAGVALGATVAGSANRVGTSVSERKGRESVSFAGAARRAAVLGAGVGGGALAGASLAAAGSLVVPAAAVGAGLAAYLSHRVSKKIDASAPAGEDKKPETTAEAVNPEERRRNTDLVNSQGRLTSKGRRRAAEIRNRFNIRRQHDLSVIDSALKNPNLSPSDRRDLELLRDLTIARGIHRDIRRKETTGQIIPTVKADKAAQQIVGDRIRSRGLSDQQKKESQAQERKKEAQAEKKYAAKNEELAQTPKDNSSFTADNQKRLNELERNKPAGLTSDEADEYRGLKNLQLSAAGYATDQMVDFWKTSEAKDLIDKKKRAKSPAEMDARDVAKLKDDVFSDQDQQRLEQLKGEAFKKLTEVDPDKARELHYLDRKDEQLGLNPSEQQRKEQLWGEAIKTLGDESEYSDLIQRQKDWGVIQEDVSRQKTSEPEEGGLSAREQRHMEVLSARDRETVTRDLMEAKNNLSLAGSQLSHTRTTGDPKEIEKASKQLAAWSEKVGEYEGELVAQKMGQRKAKLQNRRDYNTLKSDTKIAELDQKIKKNKTEQARQRKIVAEEADPGKKQKAQKKLEKTEKKGQSLESQRQDAVKRRDDADKVFERQMSSLSQPLIPADPQKAFSPRQSRE